MDTRLDFLIIGAQKCATTWLHRCCKDHPQLHVPSHKREVEFLGGDLYQKNGAQWYFDLLTGAEPSQLRGDVSVEYLSDPRAPEVVKPYAPEVKLIASLRDPLERVISAYFWYVRKALVPDLPFDEGLNRAVAAWQKPAEQDDEVSRHYRDLIERGRYAAQLQRYLEHFPRAQLYVMLYEDIEQSPLATVQGMYAFLGVDAAFVPPGLNEKPKQNAYLGVLNSLQHWSKRSLVAGRILDIANQTAQRLGLAGGKPRLPEATRAALETIYRADRAALQTLVAALPDSQVSTGVRDPKRWIHRETGDVA